MQHRDEENLNLSSLAEAQLFMRQFNWYQERLEASISILRETMFDGETLTPERIRAEVVKHWSDIMSQLPLSQQQDRLFQNSLTAALENVILSQVHDRICQEQHLKYKDEDHRIWNHCQFLTEKNVSADKLGVPEGFALCFPAALVELAALDLHTCPLDKLRCLHSTLEYLEAEIKRAIAETHVMASEQAKIPPITSRDVVALLAAILVQVKPLHLATNLNYVQSFQKTLSPCDPLWYDIFSPKRSSSDTNTNLINVSLETFERALSHLMSISVDNEEEFKHIQIGRSMSKEIELEELAQLTSYLDQKQQKKEEENAMTPLECELNHITGNIEKAISDINKSNIADILNKTEKKFNMDTVFFNK